MATNTYVAIETKTITSTVQAVTFTSIPQIYTDLVLVAMPKCDSPRDLQFRLGNGSLDTGSNYSATAMWASTSSTGSNRNSNANYMYSNYYAGATASIENVRVYHFNNYSNTTTYKTVLMRSATASGGSDALVGMWRSTSAIDTISMFPLSGDIVAGSTFTLYGIAASNIGAPKAFGGIITQDATYTYHTFGASGTFTPTQSLTVDYLVVAGGGGGGSQHAGGGGAGGLRSTVGATGGGGSLESAISVTAQNYTITVGGGGAGATSISSRGTNGSNSTFSSITSIGGGGGGSRLTQIDGATGGSGGGGGYQAFGGAGTSNQGYAGGNDNPVYAGGGGGGGAGATGSNSASSSIGGAGGTGVLITEFLITGTGVSNYYAGGGGGGGQSPDGRGGNGGAGGGGRGTIDRTTGIQGTPYTGGGGGGGGYDGVAGNGGTGGSGVVIIRYAN